MGRNLSPLVQEELEKLEKDAESRRLAMKALKSYATNMDTKAIPQFLAQVSETNNQSLPSGECTISLFEVLARVHGRSIVPQIDSIMTTIIRTLSTSGGSFPLHQACSKVVPAIARYAIDPLTPGDEKKKIICSLCKPLLSVLMSSHESLASGAALCLKALVESNNWKYASDDIVNDLCLKVASALGEKITQTNSHMGLSMALAKHNSSISEAYVGSLIQSCLHILNIGSTENNSQKRFSAIQLINFLMKCIDSRSISSELADVVDAMEKCQADHMPYVRGAAFEALQTAKMVAAQKGSKHDISSPVIHLNCHRRNDDMGKSPLVEFPTPESRTITSSIKHDAFTESPNSVKLTPSNSEYISRRTQRRLWSNDLGGVDISFNGSFIKACSSTNMAEVESEQLKNDDEGLEMSMSENEHAESFTGFVQSAGNTGSLIATPSPEMSRRQPTIDDIKIFTTPRALVRSLQSQNSCTTDGSECRMQGKSTGELYSLSSDTERSIVRKPNSSDSEKVCQSIDSVSSTVEPSKNNGHEEILVSSSIDLKRTEINGMKLVWYRKSVLIFACGLIVLCLANIMSTLRSDVNDDSFGFLVPT